jgi:hypothetical protein
LPYLTIFLLGATLLLGGGHFWYGNKARALDNDLHSMKSRIAQMRQASAASSVPYEETLGFTRELARDLRMPSFGDVLGDLSEALPKGMTVDLSKIDYDDGAVRVEAFVNTQTSFDVAYQGYQGFCRLLRQKGYNVGESEFQTSIQRSQFLVKLKKKIK